MLIFIEDVIPFSNCCEFLFHKCNLKFKAGEI
jgi:hypothetical protein